MPMDAVDAMVDAGLGLDHDELRLAVTTEAWVVAGASLREEVARLLHDTVVEVVQIGSSSVVGMLAKPIVDLAAGLSERHDLAPVRRALDAAGWIYRGDAGDAGGHVFVLEGRPSHRVAHLHVVDHRGRQWCDYERLRDLLHRSSEARRAYAAVKLRLIEELGDDRNAYTDGKSDVVRSLLGEAE